MDALFLLGRILFAAVFLVLGLAALAPASGQADRSGGPTAAAAGAGLLLVGGGAMIALGLWADLGAVMAAAAILGVTAQRHHFWRYPPGAERQAHVTHLLKNLALIGGALILVFVYHELGDDAPLSLTGPLF